MLTVWPPALPTARAHGPYYAQHHLREGVTDGYPFEENWIASHRYHWGH